MAMPQPYWITVQVAPQRTRDIRLLAPSAYAAGWLYRQLNPGATILHIRPVPQ